MILITHFNDILPYQTKDGSRIYELMHPVKQNNQNQSLALAIISSGEKTKLHAHQISEELYYILSGTGKMTLGDDQFDIKSGDTICIHPGTPHRVENTDQSELKILCCCAPAYDHSDTKLL